MILGVGKEDGPRPSRSNRVEKPRSFVFPLDLLANESPPCGRPHAESPETLPNWWLVYTKSRQEKALSCRLTALGISHYLPVHSREAVTRGKVRLVEEPLFAGYVFLFCDAYGRRDALTTNCISAIHPVSDEQRIYRELRQIDCSIAGGARLTVESLIEEGDWVRVKRGIYKGLQGRVIRRNGSARLLLAVNFLKRGASFEIHESLLEEACEPDFEKHSSIEIEFAKREAR